MNKLIQGKENLMIRTSKISISQNIIENKIFFIRNFKVMIDRDLAKLYGVETKVLNQAVKRNIDRFPDDFTFQLSKDEFKNLGSYFLASNKQNMDSRSQIVTLKRGQNIKYLPYAFTEHGILMLSSVLNSKRAIQVNIQIMRTFTKLRAMLSSHTKLRQKIEEMEKKYDYQFKIVFNAIKKLLRPPEKPKNPIGFQVQ